MDEYLEPLKERPSGSRPLCGGANIVPKPHIWNHDVSVVPFEIQLTFQSAGDGKDCNTAYFDLTICSGDTLDNRFSGFASPHDVEVLIY